MNDSANGSDRIPDSEEPVASAAPAAPADELKELDADLVGVIDEYMGQYEPAPEEATGLRERILGLVRDDLYRGPATELVTERGNAFSMADSAIRSIVRVAVDSVNGSRARSVSVDPIGDPVGSSARVRLTVSMPARTDFNASSAQIRTAVSQSLLSEVGIRAEVIDIEVEDVHLD